MHGPQDEERQRQGYVQSLREEMPRCNDSCRRQRFSFPASFGQHQEVSKKEACNAADNDGPENDQENRGQRPAHAEARMEMKQQAAQETKVDVPFLPDGGAQGAPASAVLHAEESLPPW